MKKVVILTLVLAALLGIPAIVWAAGNCIPIYGGGETCLEQPKIKVDKKVASPTTKKFVDNLSLSDPKYKAGDEISFQLSITNLSRETISLIEVEDKLPNFIIDVSGPGTIDGKKRTITFKLNGLKQNETRKFIVKGRVDDVLNSTCVVNYVKVKTGNTVADDNSKFCLEKSMCEDTTAPEATTKTTKGGFPVMPVPQKIKETPATGPEILGLIGLIPAALGGIYLRRKSDKS